MFKIVLIIFVTALISFFLTNKIIKNLFKNHRLRYVISAFLLLLLLFSILLTRQDSVDSSKSKYIPPYYDGNKVHPGKVEYEK